MEDRELLELAAKASGRVITGWNRQHGVDVAVLSDGGYWQPLLENHITNCDGDALRLAVKLSINFSVDAYPNHGWRQTEVCVGHKCEHKGIVKWLEHDIEESWGDSPYVATRRAIVRAAAEIGKAMP